MTKPNKRPCTEEELQKREVVGVIRASRFIRKCAQSHCKIDVPVILKIHNKIFKNAWTEISGKYREENIKITGSSHLPPHFSRVPELMDGLGIELEQRLGDLNISEGIIWNIGKGLNKKVLGEIEKIIFLSAWLHHKITYIHPFREGNGRTARLVANLILERYGLVGISVKIEKENKNQYRKALSQIDKMKDYEPLVTLISDGLIERYNGVAVKYYN